VTSGASMPSCLSALNAAVGDALPELRIPVSRTFIVAAALASQDYQDVHHDPGLAVERGAKDIFMNILTSNGLVERFVREWAGPRAVVKRIRIRLGAPSYPGDELVLTGEVTASDTDAGTIEIEVEAKNSLGTHLSGSVALACSAHAAHRAHLESAGADRP